MPCEGVHAIRPIKLRPYSRAMSLSEYLAPQQPDNDSSADVADNVDVYVETSIALASNPKLSLVPGRHLCHFLLHFCSALATAMEACEVG